MYWPLKLLITLFGLVPVKLRSSLGAVMGRILCLFPTRERKICRLQLEAILSTKSSDNICQQVYANLGRSIAESINLQPILDESEKYIELDDPENLTQRYKSPPTGVIVLTAHTGNWDLMAAYFAKLGIAVATIGRTARNASLQRILSELRVAYQINTIWRGAGTNDSRQIINLLKNKGLLATLIDQDLNMPGSASNFFGRFVKAPGQLIDLGRRYQVEFLTCFNYRVAPLKFRIEVRSLDPKLSTAELLDEYHKRLEQIIRKHPDQWVWIHKRWRSSSLNDTMSGKQYLEFLKSEISGRNVA